MQYPLQRVQIDVKFVPDACIIGDAKAEERKFYQYTTIDEYFRYLKAFEEHSTHSSKFFLEHMLKAFKFKVECVQTDNSPEFTKQLGSSEKLLKQRSIKHKLIQPYTPRHNGKVERSHRKDNEYFYATHAPYSFDDLKNQLAVPSRKYNNFPMRPLNWKSSSDYINAFLKSGQVFDLICLTSLKPTDVSTTLSV